MARKEKKFHFIYKITNTKNGKYYIGMHSTDNLNDGYLGSGIRLRRSIRRNGIENFKIEYLEFFDNVEVKFPGGGYYIWIKSEVYDFIQHSS